MTYERPERNPGSGEEFAKELAKIAALGAPAVSAEVVASNAEIGHVPPTQPPIPTTLTADARRKIQ